MQGYDSYFMDTDLQIGGTDQTFNMQAGRTLQKNLRGKESFVMSLAFLTGTDGRKMSKTWGNAIWLDDPPEEMYGKVMSVKDDLIIEYFTLATNVSQNIIGEAKTRLGSRENPMHLKKELARTIVSELHSKTAADAAQNHFETTIQQGETPPDIPSVSVKSQNIIDVLVAAGLAVSKSSARRLISQGGVEVNGEKITTPNYELQTPNPVVRVGSRKFAKITLQ